MVLDIYNKQAADFDNLSQYDDYLMEIEEMIDTLMSGSPEADKLKEKLKKNKQKDFQNIEERKKKKQRMQDRLKLIEKYVQKNDFKNMNNKSDLD